MSTAIAKTETPAAQERGEVATRQRNPGSVGHVPDENMPATTLTLQQDELHGSNRELAALIAGALAAVDNADDVSCQLDIRANGEVSLTFRAYRHRRQP